jgi:hypothetical protein
MLSLCPRRILVGCWSRGFNLAREHEIESLSRSRTATSVTAPRSQAARCRRRHLHRWHIRHRPDRAIPELAAADWMQFRGFIGGTSKVRAPYWIIAGYWTCARVSVGACGICGPERTGHAYAGHAPGVVADRHLLVQTA